MLDIRSQLARSTKVKQVNRTKTGYLTIHYNGPSVGNTKDLDLIKADARFHVNTRGWDGLAYHYAVGRDGALYQTRDYAARLNHSGVPQGNSESLAVLVVTGEGDPLPQAQVNGLEQLIKQVGKGPRFLLSHQEWPRLTACPGALLTRWLRGYRAQFMQSSFHTTTLYSTNVRDESNVLSHLVRVEPKGTQHEGFLFLGHPFKGDSLWFNILGTTDYIHGSVLDLTNAPPWAK